MPTSGTPTSPSPPHLGSPGTAGIVFLHGHRQMMGGMGRFARWAEIQGYAALNLRYCSMTHDVPTIVDAVEREVRAFAGQLDRPLHFVGHSLGGLLIRALFRRWRPGNLGRVVMMGTPHRGSEWADLSVRLRLGNRVLGQVGSFLTTVRDPDDEALLAPVDFPLGVIAGRTPWEPLIPRVLPRPNDGTVSVASTHIDGMADHIILPVTHALMPSNMAARAQAIAFLRDGRFRRH